MGMQQQVRFPNGHSPSWPVAADLLQRNGYTVQMRMIDGQLAFPDETPPQMWSELRVGTPGGMITLRRQGDVVDVVTWGNADDGMQKAWNALTWALAAAGEGEVVGPEGTISASDYAARMPLPFAAPSAG